MKRILFITLLCLSIAPELKAQTIKLFNEEKDQGYVIYATNNELYPISISLELDLSNLLFSESKKKVFVVPAKSEKFKIGELTVAENGIRYSFNYKFKSTIGDVTVSNYEKSFLYDLPFQKGKSYTLFQGYNGAFSHQNENSIDFTMPEGSEILAARDGIVVKIVKNNTASCPQEECGKYNNYIMIMHSDGTFANYAHIKYNGTNLNVGDSIRKGDVIAYSGNVGRSSGPHLHFVCFLGGFGKWNTLETKFRIGKGDSAILLKEGNTYLRDY
jgi:murein DD-endopeptidase MepM/ murein hydrolase activator NlpD